MRQLHIQWIHRVQILVSDTMDVDPVGDKTSPPSLTRRATGVAPHSTSYSGLKTLYLRLKIALRSQHISFLLREEFP